VTVLPEREVSKSILQDIMKFAPGMPVSTLVRALAATSAVRRVPLGEEWVQMVPFEVVFDVCMKGLKQDPYFLLENSPTFIEGEVPCDGITAGREEAQRSYFRVLR